MKQSDSDSSIYLFIIAGGTQVTQAKSLGLHGVGQAVSQTELDFRETEPLDIKIPSTPQVRVMVMDDLPMANNNNNSGSYSHKHDMTSRCAMTRYNV